MTLEHSLLAVILLLGLNLNGWALWIAYQVHRAQVIDVLQGRTIKDVVDELHRMLLTRGGAP
jgi:hypothetical protein